MTHEPVIFASAPAMSSETDAAQWRGRGASVAQSIVSTKPRGRRAGRIGDRRKALRAFIAHTAGGVEENAAWVLDNARLLQAAEKETRDFSFGLDQFPAAVDASGAETPRVVLLAREYLEAAGNRYREEDLSAFIQGFQDIAELTMGELWGLKPALQRELLERLMNAQPSGWAVLVTSLRVVSDTLWKDFFEAVNVVDTVLSRDPAGAYARMDFASRDAYRTVIADLAKHSAHTEREVAEGALAFCEKAWAASDGSRAAVRRAHIGFYLIDKGLPALEAVVNYRPSRTARLSRAVLRFPTGFYLIGIELLSFFVVIAMLSGLDSLTPIFAGLMLLLLPATQAAVDFMNNLATFLAPPRVLPKLDFSDGIPDDCVSMVAVPALLLNETQVHDLVLDLEIRFLANRDPNLYFALITDSPDADQPNDDRDRLVDVCRELIEGLNRRYQVDGRSLLFLLHRHRAYNQSEGRWMGWERKRGKLLDLNQLLRGGFDAFPVKVGDVSVLPHIQYVLTLDSDTQLPRESAAKLIGTLAHPLNRAVIDPASRMVVEGYGILQPRIGISIQSASRSRLAALYSGQTGFDIYTRAVSDVYQDLFGEGIFTGKGIYEVDALNEVLHQRFPDNALLSHDLIEGAYARVALVSDIEFIDDYPSHFSAYSRRKHRWVRGDWQILRWVLSRVPDYHGNLIDNPLPVISHWKIVDNLRRSLLEPSLVILFLGAWFYLPGPPLFWTLATVSMLFIPSLWGVLFAMGRAPSGSRALLIWARDTARAFVTANLAALLSIVFLFHQALLSIDAIVRSVLRVFITRRRLLEWETAAEAENAAYRKATVDTYLEWTPWIALVIGVALWFVRPDSFPAAAPVLALWFASRAISRWLNRPPRTRNCELSSADKQFLRDSAERIHRYFHDWSSEAANWLIPDSVREDGAAELRLSPTNLAMLLNARIAAVHLGLVSVAEFSYQTRQTLERVCSLPKHRGHLFNWYDILTLRPISPRFVSTVDSGNLAASLWTLKQAALTFAADRNNRSDVTEQIAGDLHNIAETCETLVREMDFKFLYHPRKKALSVGYDATSQSLEKSCYDLVASEARIAAFVAIAKGDIPQEAWFHLGRAHTLFRGERILLSWTGTMFEYLMPVLWMRHYPRTLLARSMTSIVRAQRDYARRKGVPWGVSESGCLGEAQGGYGYAPFGIPGIAMKRVNTSKLVISPYSSFLAMCVDPASAIQNLRRMEGFDWKGRYGFYEAIDYSHAGGEVVRSWMAHHQGMSLLAIVNLLFDNPMQRYFHAEPHVLATELLLHERVPNAALAEPDAPPLPALAPAPA